MTQSKAAVLDAVKAPLSIEQLELLGHEGAGVVEAVGPGVTTCQVGDHVLTSYIPSCGTCRYCTIGRPNLCELRDRPRHLMLDGTTRFRRRDGSAVNHFLQVSSFATQAVLLEQGVIPIRKDAPLDVVCLVSCGGAARIIAVDRLRYKLGLADEFGATHLVDASTEDPVARVREITGGFGADYAFEAIGAPRVIETMLDCLHRGGEAYVIGVSPHG